MWLNGIYQCGGKLQIVWNASWLAVGHSFGGIQVLFEDGNNYKWKNALEEGKTMQVETEGVQNSRPNLNEGKVNYEDFFESRKRILK